jgi:hypothetical protein
MVLGWGLAIYLGIRLRFYRKLEGIAAMLLGTILVALTYPQVSLPAHNEGIVPFDFMRSFVPEMWWAFFPLLHLFWSWAYIAVRLYQERAATLHDLWDRIRTRRLVDVEIVLLVALAGLVPGMVMHIDGGSAFYFSDVQRWLALGCLLSLPLRSIAVRHRDEIADESLRPTEGATWIGRIRTGRVMVALVAIPMIVTMALNAVYWPKRFAQANAATRALLYPQESRETIPAGIHGLPYLTDAGTLRAGLARAENYRVVTQLRNLSGMSARDREMTALFIPQTEEGYWTALKRPGACSFSSFVAPALSTMAMVDGMPPFGCPLSPYYGLGEYTPRRWQQSAAAASLQNVCRKARIAGFDRVMVLHFDPAGEMSSTTSRCTAKGPVAITLHASNDR